MYIVLTSVNLQLLLYIVIKGQYLLPFTMCCPAEFKRSRCEPNSYMEEEEEVISLLLHVYRHLFVVFL